jgi:geranylgeranyl diphosphate synthase type II
LLKVFKVFNKTAIEVCIGQQLDMDYEKTVVVRQDEYLRMIELKTAVLLAASLKIGAIIGGAEDKDADLLYEAGRNLGLAFQIQDDFLDVWGDVKSFGKTLGGDIVANKKTFPIVKAMEIASAEQFKQFQEQFSIKDSDAETKIRKVTGLYEQLNIKDITEILVYDYINKAVAFIQKVNVDETRKRELINLAGSLIGRNQ